MTEGEIVSGQQSAWTLQKKLGEGDAGEVYLVESLLGARQAILKRPHKSAFTGDMLRQAAQIRTEGKILQALNVVLRLRPDSGVRVPNLLDQSKPGAEFIDRSFIIVEKASGFDLSALMRISRMGLSGSIETESGSLGPEDQVFMQSLASSGQIPHRILLKTLSLLIGLLEYIHSARVTLDDLDAWGIIWNDVKPEHLYWDPRHSSLTIIDWGNAQFLDSDGTTKDRQYSRLDDIRQLYDGMGRFLAMAAPDLPAKVNWPTELTQDNIRPESLAMLDERLNAAYQREIKGLTKIHQREEDLLSSDATEANLLQQLETIHSDLLTHGEIPDYAGALRLVSSAAARLAMADDLDALRELCAWAEKLPIGSEIDWQLIADIAQITGHCAGRSRRNFLDAIQAAICQDWETVHWNLLVAIQDYPEPDWWIDISSRLRHLALGVETDALRPLVAVSRCSLSLQAVARQFTDTSETPGSHSVILSAISQLKEEIIPKWSLRDPDPPHAGLGYTDIEALLADIGEELPEEAHAIQQVLSQPRAQVNTILNAWERRDFVSASQELRKYLLWDPDRRRILRAEQAILAAPGWLQTAHVGPQKEDDFIEFVTDLEFDGRELRNQVGPAAWLDGLLEACKKLRRGVWPADLLASQPGLVRELPWLRRFERSEQALVGTGENEPSAPSPETPTFVPLSGTYDGPFGPRRGLQFVEPLDVWMPEARGSSARVYLGLIDQKENPPAKVALKLMRMDKIAYAQPLFDEEVKILSAMRDVPGVTPMLECGFLHLGEKERMPLDHEREALQQLQGDAYRIGPDAWKEFNEQLEPRLKDSWIPYLAIEIKPKEDNLLNLCDAGLNRGHFLPVITLLQMAIQICDIIQIAHERNIVYRDHKILHYYWQEQTHGVYVIDWNVARLHPEGLSEYERQMDMVQFAARGLHHILTGRSAPGALPLGPNRPEEIEQAAASYQAQWTYDDQRLPEDLRNVLEHALAAEYTSAIALREDLKKSYAQLPSSHL